MCVCVCGGGGGGEGVGGGVGDFIHVASQDSYIACGAVCEKQTNYRVTKSASPIPDRLSFTVGHIRCPAGTVNSLIPRKVTELLRLWMLTYRFGYFWSHPIRQKNGFSHWFASVCLLAYTNLRSDVALTLTTPPARSADEKIEEVICKKSLFFFSLGKLKKGHFKM